MLYLIGGHSRKDTIEFYTQMACAIAFCVFSFVYLYYYQGELLAVAQFVLSGGKTHYGNMVGAILITLTLYLLQCAVMYVAKLRRRAHAFTYFPSLLILTVITDVSPNIDKHFFAFDPVYRRTVCIQNINVFIWIQNPVQFGCRNGFG